MDANLGTVNRFCTFVAGGLSTELTSSFTYSVFPLQERLTVEIAQTIDYILKPKGVAVVLESNHMCMQMRGVQNKNSYASTSSMIGLFRDDHKTRKEFLDLISMDKKF